MTTWVLLQPDLKEAPSTWPQNLTASTVQRSRVWGQLSKLLNATTSDSWVEILPYCGSWGKGAGTQQQVGSGRWYRFSRGGRCSNKQQIVDNCDFYDINSHKIRTPVAIVSHKNNSFQLTHGTVCEMMQGTDLYIMHTHTHIHTHRIKGLLGYRMSKHCQMWTQRDNESASNSSIRNWKDDSNFAPHNLMRP